MMIHDRYLELLHGEIDGVNSPRQSRKLRQYMETNPEARKLYQDLRSMSDMFSRLSPVDPPTNLKTLIVNQLPHEPSLPRPERGRLVFSLERFLGRRKFGYAYAFASGLALGIVLISFAVALFLKPGALNVSDLYGAMMKNSVPENFRTAPAIEINHPEVHGSVVLSSSDEAILVHLTLRTPRELTARLEFNPKSIQFLGFKKFSPANSALTVDQQSVQFTTSGENTCLIAFSRTGMDHTPIHIRLLREGRILEEWDVPVDETTSNYQ
jgi:hypothetical protein